MDSGGFFAGVGEREEGWRRKNEGNGRWGGGLKGMMKRDQ